MPSEPNSSLRTRLRRNRLWVAAGGAVVAAAAVVGFWAFDTAPGNAVARPEKSTGDADGAFRPSETQWASLRLAPVRQVAFRDERATDGKIAINEDTTTPVFSPYLRPGQQADRPARRPRRARRAAVRHRGERVRAGPERPHHRRRRRREGEVAAHAGADRREAAARAAGDPRRRAEGPRAGAVRPGRRAGRPALGRDRARRRAQPAAHPRPLGRGDRAAREADRIGAEAIVAAPIGGTIIQRKVGLRPVHQRRRQRPGLHGRQSLDGVADRQRARVGRAQA